MYSDVVLVQSSRCIAGGLQSWYTTSVGHTWCDQFDHLRDEGYPAPPRCVRDARDSVVSMRVGYMAGLFEYYLYMMTAVGVIPV